jgi:uncharacterized protein
MRRSRYNIYFDAGNSLSFIYNTLANTLLLVDNSVRQYLEKNQLEKIDASVVTSLKKCGIIVDGDELHIYRLNHNITQYNADTSSFLVFTTYACNLCCPYCYEGPADAEYRSQFMRPETTSDVVHFICDQTRKNKSRAVTIALYGGEPLLNMECCETVLKKVSHFCENNRISFQTMIMSNGTLLTEKVYTVLKDYLSHIHITLDGSLLFHDKTRVQKNGSGTYEQILQNVSLLKNTKNHLSIRINVNEENKHSIHEVFNDLEEIGLKGRPHFYLYFSQIIPYTFCLAFSHPESKEQMKKFSTCYSDLVDMAKEKGWESHVIVGTTEYHGVSCRYVQHGTYSIGPLGDIYVCPAVAGDARYRIGKIKGSVEWYPQYYAVMTRDPSLTVPCKTCEFLPLCKGGCPVASFAQEETQCNFTKEVLYERLKLYLESRYKAL